MFFLKRVVVGFQVKIALWLLATEFYSTPSAQMSCIWSLKDLVIITLPLSPVPVKEAAG